MTLMFEQAVFQDTVYIATPFHLPHHAFSAELMTKWMQKSKCDTLSTFPSRVEPALNDPKYMAELKKLTNLLTGGGNYQAHAIFNRCQTHADKNCSCSLS